MPLTTFMDANSVNPEPRRRHLSPVTDLEAGPDEPRFDTVSRIGSGASTPDPLPDSVRLDMARAADLWAELDDDGRQLRYEVDDETGRVSAELRDSAGTRLRAVPLAQALGTGNDDSPAA